MFEKMIRHQYEFVFSFRNLTDILLNSKVEGVYWFFPMIISIYLFLPFLSLLTELRFRKILWYLVGYALLCNALAPFVTSLCGMQWSIYSPLGGFAIFVILGYLLSTQLLKKPVRYTIYFLGAVGSIIRYVGIYFFCLKYGNKNPIFFDYNGIYSYFLAIAVFVFIQNCDWERILNSLERLLNINIIPHVSAISACSFGIYLIHRIVMEFEQGILHLSPSSVIWRLGFPFITYGICLLIVFILKKIKFLKWLVP